MQPVATSPDNSLQQNLIANSQFGSGQLAGSRWPIGCISLEITQRCNLDCTLCYLSDLSEAVHDVPLAELLRRIDQIAERYGADTDIQISGGDPTLRPLEDLICIVRHIREHGMRCSLFTNGILAKRAMLKELAQAGLNDVAFHVDITQQRKGYDNEQALNAVRLEYLNRVRGLGLSVFFNTTVCADNLAQLPDLVRFFRDHADQISFASFQMQADTGRGIWGRRAGAITQANVEALIAQGLGCALNFDAVQIGHPHCNRFAMAFIAGGQAIDALSETSLVHRFVAITAKVRANRGMPLRTAASFIVAAGRGGFFWHGLGWLTRLVWRLRAGLAGQLRRGQLRVHKLSIMTHNFMDAAALDQERLDCCVFMAAGPTGPVPMCQYNAERDHYLLQLMVVDGEPWHPLRGRESAVSLAHTLGKDRHGSNQAVVVPIKWLKGRRREQANAERRRQRTAP